jgi:hypothetical protein
MNAGLRATILAPGDFQIVNSAAQQCNRALMPKACDAL